MLSDGVDESAAKVDVPAGCRDNGDRRGPGGEEPAYANNFVHVASGVSIAGPAPRQGNGWHVGDDVSGETVLVARTLELAVELAPIVATLASARQFLTPAAKAA